MPCGGHPGQTIANDNLVAWLFDPEVDSSTYLVKEVGGVCNNQVFRRKACFDEGADFCGVSEAFVKRNNLDNYVVDRGNFQVTFGNGQSESIPNRTIFLSIFVDEMTGFDYEFNIVMGVAWKRKMTPIIDWGTYSVYSTDE
ncbi:hypothetical protein PHMEG_00035093 [Phytophthora megakarya]|uniref:Uncharacterized protein n=1 Tax=Phytophthora megakarya TaxID=4795 RepID=A0A225UPY5_9STRA|nr:hypothetical protein PHMEG_00035093 [Phytophthora megakarya]